MVVEFNVANSARVVITGHLVIYTQTTFNQQHVKELIYIINLQAAALAESLTRLDLMMCLSWFSSLHYWCLSSTIHTTLKEDILALKHTNLNKPFGEVAQLTTGFDSL
jgi:hypothetical protein